MPESGHTPRDTPGSGVAGRSLYREAGQEPAVAAAAISAAVRTSCSRTGVA